MTIRRCLYLITFIIFGNIGAQPILNEIMPSNASDYMIKETYNFPDWIELYNNKSSSITLSSYYISDDKANLKKKKLPNVTLNAGQYYVIYCDKLNISNHANFSMGSGETVFLSNSSNQIVDSFKIKDTHPDISFGRNPDDLNIWLYCVDPTPGKKNNITWAKLPAKRPVFSSPAGSYSSSLSVSLIGNKIKYSTNGKKPESNSSSYSSPISISQTTVVKARSFEDGCLPSKPYANTYFIGEHKFTLPVISLSFTPEYFWDDEIGIYVEGTNGIGGNCLEYVHLETANWNQPWEREAYLEYFDENGIKQLSQPIGVKIFGRCSRTFFEQKSLSIYARGKYGDKDFDYAFFDDKQDIRRYKSIALRNAGNDFKEHFLQDAYLQSLVSSSVDIDYISYKPAILYMNGEYYGITNIREKSNEDYFLHNYAIPEDSLDLVQGIYESIEEPHFEEICGSKKDFDAIISFISSNSLANEDNYNWVTSQFDMQELLNYLAIQIYIANTDWPGNNNRFWKKSNNGKWRWILFDIEFGFCWEVASHQTIHFAMETDGPDWPNPPWATLLFRKLMENHGFRDDFAKTILTLRNTVFNPEWTGFVLDSLSNRIDNEMKYHKVRYRSTYSSWKSGLNGLKSYALARYNFIPEYVSSYFGLGGNEVNVTVSNEKPLQGDVAVNNSVIKNYPFNMQTYKNLELSLKAIPAKGYRFKYWEVDGGTIYSTQRILETDTGYNISLEPIFEPIEEVVDITINEVASASDIYRDEFGEKAGYVEIINNAGQEAVLYGYFLSDDKSNLMRYALPDSTVVDAGGFFTIYADADAKQGKLHASFKPSENGETIYLSQKVGDMITIRDSVKFKYLVENYSYGRYENGEGEWQFMLYPTPNLPNRPEKPIIDIDAGEMSYNINVFPNPSDGVINIMLDVEDIFNRTYLMDIVDLGGRTVSLHNQLTANTNFFDIGYLGNGIYFIRIFESGGMVYTSKIVVVNGR